MRLFVFPEFRNMELLARFRSTFPNIPCSEYTTTEFTEQRLQPTPVRCENVKLFYDYETEADKVDEILNIMVELGFRIVDRHPYRIYHHKVKYIDRITKEEKTKTIVETKYFRDRVILCG